MSKKSITFDPESFVAAVETVADKVTGRRMGDLRISSVETFKPASELTPREIQELRARLGVSQSVFAAMLNVPVVTAISWEKGRRSPSGAALRLLEMASKHPELFLTTAEEGR